MNEYEMFRYFLECYFNVSADYDELEKLVQEFQMTEKGKYSKLLIDELGGIQKNNNWDLLQDFVRKHGMRNMNQNKLKWLVQSILDNLETK